MSAMMEHLPADQQLFNGAFAGEATGFTDIAFENDDFHDIVGMVERGELDLSGFPAACAAAAATDGNNAQDHVTGPDTFSGLIAVNTESSFRNGGYAPAPAAETIDPRLLMMNGNAPGLVDEYPPQQYPAAARPFSGVSAVNAGQDHVTGPVDTTALSGTIAVNDSQNFGPHAVSMDTQRPAVENGSDEFLVPYGGSLGDYAGGFATPPDSGYESPFKGPAQQDSPNIYGYVQTPEELVDYRPKHLAGQMAGPIYGNVGQQGGCAYAPQGMGGYYQPGLPAGQQALPAYATMGPVVAPTPAALAAASAPPAARAGNRVGAIPAWGPVFKAHKRRCDHPDRLDQTWCAGEYVPFKKGTNGQPDRQARRIPCPMTTGGDVCERRYEAVQKQWWVCKDGSMVNGVWGHLAPDGTVQQDGTGRKLDGSAGRPRASTRRRPLERAVVAHARC